MGRKWKHIISATTTGAHLRYIADHFRPEEALECMASWDESPISALARSWVESRTVYTFLAPDRTPLCVAGVVDKPPEDGWHDFWMLGTTDILKHKLEFLRACQRYKVQFLCCYPRLRAYIDARYDLSLKWARWLGCEILAPAPYGRNGALFCEVRLQWAAQ